MLFLIPGGGVTKSRDNGDDARNGFVGDGEDPDLDRCDIEGFDFTVLGLLNDRSIGP